MIFFGDFIFLRDGDGFLTGEVFFTGDADFLFYPLFILVSSSESMSDWETSSSSESMSDYSSAVFPLFYEWDTGYILLLGAFFGSFLLLSKGFLECAGPVSVK